MPHACAAKNVLTALEVDRAVAIADALRGGREVTDAELDLLLPPPWRRASAQFWTPVAVARKAAAWLARAGSRRVLDVGSGVGKLCVVGALTTELSFHGIEQRPPLVDVARGLAAMFALGDRVSFQSGKLQQASFFAHDALYFFNPFGENVVQREDWLDVSVELSQERLEKDVWFIERTLREAPMRTRVVTYHGYGGPLPDSYHPTVCAPAGTGVLRLWTKIHAETRGRCWLELDDVLPLSVAESALRQPGNEVEGVKTSPPR